MPGSVTVVPFSCQVTKELKGIEVTSCRHFLFLCIRPSMWTFVDIVFLFSLLFFLRPYIVNLLPYIARICRREEEAVQETLSNSMPKICSALMAFANDSEVKVRLNSMPNRCHVWPDGIFWNADPFVTRLVWWYINISWSVTRNNCIAVFKIKVIGLI